MPTNPMGVLKALSQSPLHIPTNSVGICRYAHEPHGHSQSPFQSPLHIPMIRIVVMCHDAHTLTTLEGVGGTLDVEGSMRLVVFRIKWV